MEIMIAAFGTAQRKQTRYIIVATMVVHIKVLFDIMQMKIYYTVHILFTIVVTLRSVVGLRVLYPLQVYRLW